MLNFIRQNLFTITVVTIYIVFIGYLCFNIAEKPETKCKEICKSGYKYLVCSDNVVQMMEGEGELFFLSKCK